MSMTDEMNNIIGMTPKQYCVQCDNYEETCYGEEPYICECKMSDIKELLAKNDNLVSLHIIEYDGTEHLLEVRSFEFRKNQVSSLLRFTMADGTVTTMTNVAVVKIV